MTPHLEAILGILPALFFITYLYKRLVRVRNARLRLIEVSNKGNYSIRCLKYHDNGYPREETYWRDGKRHRIEGPALTEWFDNNSVAGISYYKEGQCHRDGGLPARQIFDKERSPLSMEFYVEGKLHREDGPAVLYGEASYDFRRGRKGRFSWKDEFVTFWELYEKVSTPNKEILLRDWLPEIESYD